MGATARNVSVAVLFAATLKFVESPQVSVEPVMRGLVIPKPLYTDDPAMYDKALGKKSVMSSTLKTCPDVLVNVSE